MLKDFLKSFPFASVSIGLIGAIIAPSMVTGKNIVINDAIVQAGWCISGDAICLLKVYGWISFWLLVAGFGIDFTTKYFNKIRNRIEAAKKSTVEKVSPKQEPDQSLFAPKKKGVRQPQNYKFFSRHLNEITKGEKISSIGRRFLETVKTSPPFLGRRSSIVSPAVEQKFTEHFLAKEIRDSIKGKASYRMSGKDTHESIAENVYGDAKYANIVRGASFTIINGTFIHLPYIDITSSLGLSPKEIDEKVLCAEDAWIEPTVNELVDQFNLVKSETLRLMKWVYDAAQKTLNKKSEKQPKQKEQKRSPH